MPRWVADLVVSEDTDRDPEQVVGIRFALPLVLRVQLGCQCQRDLGPASIGSWELRDFYEQPCAG
jgi:hypothetical protein